MPLPPIWISADAQALQIPLLNAPYRDLVNAATVSLNKAIVPVDANIAKSKDIAARLDIWYQQRYAAVADPVKDMADAAANYIGDTMASGVYMFVPVPDFGGFPAMVDALTRSLTVAGDANRPQFTDEELVAGVVLLAAGGRLQVLIALSAAVTLLGGDASQITAAISDLMTTSGPMAAIADIAGNLVHKAQDAWNDEEKAVVNWWDNSAAGKVIAGVGSAAAVAENQLAGFPQNIFDSVAASVAPIIPVIPPIPTIPTDLLGDAIKLATGSSGDPLIGHWKAITVGSVANSLVPGAASIATVAAKAIDQIGAVTKNTADQLTKAMTKVTNDLVADKADTAKTGADLGDIVGSHLNDLAKLSVSALVIPPAKGGIHQLGWALSQGLSENAVNAPTVSADEACFTIFICGGASDITKMTQTIRQVGQVFGIPLLANWGTI
jgi:hypothetical protein